jgi:hypothetical protein
LFLPLEDNDVILMDNIVALVRHKGRTVITGRDNSVRESVFTPATLGRRSSRLITRKNEGMKAEDQTRRTRTTWTEDK